MMISAVVLALVIMTVSTIKLGEQMRTVEFMDALQAKGRLTQRLNDAGGKRVSKVRGARVDRIERVPDLTRSLARIDDLLTARAREEEGEHAK